MCMCVLKAVNLMVLIVRAQKAKGKMAWPIQRIPHTHPVRLPPNPPPCPFVPAFSTHPNFRDIWYEERRGGFSFGGKRKEKKGNEDKRVGRYTQLPPEGWEVRDGGRRETCVRRIVGVVVIE